MDNLAHKLDDNDKRYTYDDYEQWEDGSRWELIDGVPYMMSPAPLRIHQEISGEIFGQLYNFLKDKPCKVFHAPFDVRLNADKMNKKNDTVVQPDIVVVCDKSKLDDKGCIGSPDMVIEILSPSTSKRDMVIKFNKYLEAGIREYWIINPEIKIVHAYILENGKYMVSCYDETNTIPVHVLEGCEITLADVFDFE